ncbi:MAG: gamma-glutamyltransferase [Bacteroidales bacterium]
MVRDARHVWIDAYGRDTAARYRLCREGFPVTEVIAYYLESGTNNLKKYPNVADVYMPGGKSPAKGEIFKNPALANTLEKIAKGGRNEFYRGSIARTIAQFMKEQGGFLTYDDLSRHHSEWVEPIHTNYRGYDVWELPPNGQGTAALQILNILEGYNIKEMGFGSAKYIHHFVEAKKLAFEDRAKYYADPAFNDLPVDQLISKEYATQRRKLINSSKAAKSYSAGKLEQGNTIYMTVADKYGNMVSLIQSNYRGLGSGMCPPGLGLFSRTAANCSASRRDTSMHLHPAKSHSIPLYQPLLQRMANHGLASG